MRALDSSYGAVMRLAKQRPQDLPAVREAYTMWLETSRPVAGKWILNQLADLAAPQPHSLGSLARRGILRTVDTSRGGNRAYYVPQDAEGVRRALADLGML